jgi:hypothetical protein
MAILSLDSPKELSKITDYIDYIGENHIRKFTQTTFFQHIYEGLLDSPLFSMLAPELQSIGLSLTSQ